MRKVKKYLSSESPAQSIPYDKYRRTLRQPQGDQSPFPYNPQPLARTRQSVFGVRLSIIPKAAPFSPDAPLRLLSHLHCLNSPIILELSTNQKSTAAALLCQPQQASVLESLIRGAGDWEVESEPLTLPHASVGVSGHLTRPNVPAWLPLNSVTDSGSAVPAILEALAPESETDRATVTWCIQPTTQERIDTAYKEITTIKPAPTFLAFLARLLIKEPPYNQVTRHLQEHVRQPIFARQMQQHIEDRLAKPQLFDVQATVTISTKNYQRLTEKSKAIAAVISQALDAGFTGLTIETWQQGTWQPDIHSPIVKNRPTLLLSPEELAVCWSPPTVSTIYGIRTLKRQPVLLPPELTNATGCPIGTHHQRGVDIEIPLSPAALHSAPLVAIGQTGSGKSTSLFHIQKFFANASSKPSIFILDPHGTLTTNFVLHAISNERAADTFYFELGNVNYPVQLPIFKRFNGVSHDAYVSTTFALLKTLFNDTNAYARMESALYAFVSTLCSLEKASLWDIIRLISEPYFRRKALAQVSNDLVTLSWWHRFESLSQSAQQDIVAPILSRLDRLYRSVAVRNMLLACDGHNIMQLLDEGKIILISLAGSSIESEANLLGELMLSRLRMHLSQRLNSDNLSHYKQVYAAVDESHRFSLGTLPILLKESRKTKLSLLLTTQYLSGWQQAVSDAVAGNTGTLLAFQLGIDDARKLSPTLSPFTVEDLVSHDRHECIVATTTAKGTRLPAFDIKTRDIATQPNYALLEQIREQTRNRFALPRHEAEAEIAAVMGRHPDNRVSNDDEEVYEG